VARAGGGRAHSRYICQTCGESFLRWEGQCRACGAWNSLVETVVHEPSAGARAAARAAVGGARPAALPLSALADEDRSRTRVGIGELDRVLGGGVVPGSLVLLGGEPGIGKSTLLLQVAAAVAAGQGSDVGGAADGAPAAGAIPTTGVLYATGEESAGQIRLRAGRLGLLSGPAADGISVVAESDVERICELARAARPRLLIVDSIQTATVGDLEGVAGSVGQVRESALRLMDLAKGEGIAVIVVGHVTKDGSLAGPKTLEHVVDVVLDLEGERFASLRLLRAPKNRYGSTEEVGVFEMGESGLGEIVDPGRAFLADHDGPAPGSVVAPSLEGSRPLLVEVQALVTPAGAGSPRRQARGVDPGRVSLLVAVLGRRAGIGLSSHDVHVNLAGGLSLDEPGLDLPLALALASSLRDRPVIPGTVAIGEIGLLGELRPVGGLERRLREAARLGFDRAIVPLPGRRAVLPDVPGIEILRAGSLRDAISRALSAAPESTPAQRGERSGAMLG
jgi:DNA repair protein RadA/Sms